MSLSALTLALSALLLFARLGHYPLWDDEASTALIGKGVWATGDTSAVVGRNLVAFRGGAELDNLRVRYLPPLQYYVAAPFVGPGEPSAFRARLPFACFGLATIALMLWWLRRTTTNLLAWSVTCLAIVCNVSLMLYARQSRYYALAIFLTVVVLYLYETYRGGRWKLVLLTAASVGLFASNYLSWCALYVCAALDYALWGRHRYSLTRRDCLVLLVPQVVLSGFLVAIWNPLGKHVTESTRPEGLPEKLTLLWWNVRDLAACEFGVVALVAAAPVAFIVCRNSHLLRLPLAIVMYVLVITGLSPQTVTTTSVADMRYLAPMIPMCIATGAAVISALSFGRWWIALPVAAIAFGTNVLNLGRPDLVAERPRHFGSTIGEYIGELADPPPDPYSAMSRWINTNVRDGESIWVITEGQAYPLMYHSPHAVYAWQLSAPPAGQFAQLDPIHFKGARLPDYILAAGPGLEWLMTQVRFPPDSRRYQLFKIDAFWKDLYRPELIWRRFTPVADYDHERDVIYVLKRLTVTNPE